MGSMRYVAAYCLAALGGATPSAKDIEKILSSVGVDCDADLAGKVVSELEGKDLQAVIEGMEKVGSMPVGGGGGGGAAPAAADAPAAVEEKKEEEPEEESDDDMGFGLFD